MAFPGFPFPDFENSFIGHCEVLDYLVSYADHYHLRDNIKVTLIVVNPQTSVIFLLSSYFWFESTVRALRDVGLTAAAPERRLDGQDTEPEVGKKHGRVFWGGLRLQRVRTGTGSPGSSLLRSSDWVKCRVAATIPNRLSRTCPDTTLFRASRCTHTISGTRPIWTKSGTLPLSALARLELTWPRNCATKFDRYCSSRLALHADLSLTLTPCVDYKCDDGWYLIFPVRPELSSPNPNFSKAEFGTTDLDFWNYRSQISSCI
jgi:hypothetical protein